MMLPFEISLGWRFVRNAKSGRSTRSLSFITWVSVLGIALGVAALIVVLSVMNGFQYEVRDRMLAVVAQVEITTSDAANASNSPVDWTSVATKIANEPAVLASSPYTSHTVLITATNGRLQGAVLRGVDPAGEALVIDPRMRQSLAQMAQLQAGQFGIVLGADLAAQLGVQVGDSVTLMSPTGLASPAGVLPRVKRMTVVGSVQSGYGPFDATVAFAHVQDAQRIFRLDQPTGLRVRIDDVAQSPQVSAHLQKVLGAPFKVQDWTQQDKKWYAAVVLEKRMMAIILTLMVAIAAFNLVCGLVMAVNDKRADIAILRTMGASPKSVMLTFLMQGAFAGVAGTLAGVVLGLVLATQLGSIVPAVESLLGVTFFPTDIYMSSRIPSDPRTSDIVPVALVSLLMAFLATLYPSWRASRVEPAQALRYE